MWRAFFAILNFAGATELPLTTYRSIKNSKLFLSISSSGTAAMRVNTFQTAASEFSKIASNSIRKCIILLGVRCCGSVRSTDFRIAREREKEANISDVNLARFLDLFNCMESRSV